MWMKVHKVKASHSNESSTDRNMSKAGYRSCGKQTLRFFTEHQNDDGMGTVGVGE